MRRRRTTGAASGPSFEVVLGDGSTATLSSGSCTGDPAGTSADSSSPPEACVLEPPTLEGSLTLRGAAGRDRPYEVGGPGVGDVDWLTGEVRFQARA